MSDIDALKAQVAALEARLNAASPPPPEPEPPLVIRAPHVYTPPATRSVAILADHASLRPLGLRGTRQLAAAVALSKGEPVPGSEVPAAYEAVMKRLAAARGRGLSWRVALAECDLAVPDDDELGYQARALRDSLPALWDGISSVMGQLETRLPAWVFDRLIKSFRPLI